MKQKLKVTATVTCNKKKHRISLTEQGKLVFHDHPEGFKKDKALVSLGGVCCKCYKVLSVWKMYAGKETRKMIGRDLPKEFEEVFDEICANSRQIDYVHYLETRDKPNREKKAIMYLLTKLFYKSLKLKTNLQTRLVINDFVDAKTRVNVKSQILTRDNINVYLYGIPLLLISVISMPSDWYKTVYKKGIALVDDNLILSLIEEQTSHDAILLKVIALYKSGIKYSARQAIVKIEGDNKTLVWDNHR